MGERREEGGKGLTYGEVTCSADEDAFALCDQLANNFYKGMSLHFTVQVYIFTRSWKKQTFPV